MYRGPFPTVESREPVRMLDREIVSAQPFLEELEAALPTPRAGGIAPGPSNGWADSGDVAAGAACQEGGMGCHCSSTRSSTVSASSASDSRLSRPASSSA